MSNATADNLGPDKHDHGADAHAHKKHVHDPEEHRHFEDQTTRSREKQQSLGLFSSIREALTATDPADRAHDIILKDVRRNIQRTLGGNTAALRSRVTDFEKASRQKEFHGAHGKVRAFFRWISGKGYENHYLHEQYPEGMTHHDVDDAAEMDVKKPVVFDAERIWRQRFDENSAAFAALSDPDKKEIQDTKKLLKKKLGDKVIDEMEDYPEMTATLGYLFELKRRNPAMRLNTFVENALGIKATETPSDLDAAETKAILDKAVAKKQALEEMVNTDDHHKKLDPDLIGSIGKKGNEIIKLETDLKNAKKNLDKLVNAKATQHPDAARLPGFKTALRNRQSDLEDAQDLLRGNPSDVTLQSNVQKARAAHALAKKELEEAQDNVNAHASSQQQAERGAQLKIEEARRNVEDKKEVLKQAKEQYKNLAEQYHLFFENYKSFSRALEALAPAAERAKPEHPLHIPTPAPSPLPLKIQAFQEFQKLAEDLHHLPDPSDPTSDFATKITGHGSHFKTAYNFIAQNNFTRKWKDLKPTFDEKYSKLEKSEAKMKEQKDVVSEHMSPVELMYKIHYHSKTTKVSEGGEMPDASPLNDIQKRRIRYDSLLFARYYMIEAKDQSSFVKNQIRLKEIYRKSGLFRRIKSFPKLDTMLKRLRVLEVPKKGEDGKTEKPFAELVLRGKMTQTDLRMALSHKQIKPDHLPLLVAHLEAILNGERGKHIRYEDLRPLTNLITNLKILRQEHLHNKFKGEIAKKPGSFPDKITALWKNDFEAEDALATEYHEAIDKDALFENIRDAHWYQLSRQAPYEKKLRELKEQMKEKMTKENWSRGKVVEFLKKNGVPAAAAVATGLALAYSAKKLGKKIASKLPQTAGEKAGTVKEAGILRKIGYQATRPFRFVGNKVVTPLAKLTIGTPIKYGVLYPAKGLAKLAGLGKKGLVTSGKFVANLPKETWKGAKKFVVSDTKKAASATGDFFKSFFKSGGGGGHGGHGGGHH